MRARRGADRVSIHARDVRAPRSPHAWALDAALWLVVGGVALANGGQLTREPPATRRRSPLRLSTLRATSRLQGQPIPTCSA